MKQTCNTLPAFSFVVGCGTLRPSTCTTHQQQGGEAKAVTALAQGVAGGPERSLGGAISRAPILRRGQNEALLGWMNRYLRQTP